MPVICELPSLARDMASFSPLMELGDPSSGTRIFLNLFWSMIPLEVLSIYQIQLI